MTKKDKVIMVKKDKIIVQHVCSKEVEISNINSRLTLMQSDINHIKELFEKAEKLFKGYF